LKFYDDITFVSYFTVKPEKEDIVNYLEEFQNLLLTNNNELWLLGFMLQSLDLNNLPKKIKPFLSIADLVNKL